MDSIKRIFLGVGSDPKVVAAFRAFALYAVPIAGTLLVGWLNSITDPRYYGVALACVPLVRALVEGITDQVKRPRMNEANPPPVAGGGGRDLID